jgi:hypothetical protein
MELQHDQTLGGEQMTDEQNDPDEGFGDKDPDDAVDDEADDDGK